MTDRPTGVIQLPNIPLTDSQAAAIKRLLANGADPEDLATLVGGTYRRVPADAEDRSVKGRTL